MNDDVERALNANYKEIRSLVYPLLMFLWIFYAGMLIIQPWLIACFLGVFFVSANASRYVRFVADIIAVRSGVIGYYDAQAYFHLHFERETRWMRFTLKYFGPFFHQPLYRCRSRLLHGWKLKHTEVE